MLLCVVGSLAVQIIPVEWVRWLGLLPILIGLRWLMERASPRPKPAAHEVGYERDHRVGGVLTVAGVTFANGGDNIGVYVPLSLIWSCPSYLGPSPFLPP